MTPAWLFISATVLLSRLTLLFQDGRVRNRTVLLALTIQEAALLAFEPNKLLWGLAVAWLVLALVWWRLEKSHGADTSEAARHRTATRLGLLVCYILVSGVCCSTPLALTLRPEVAATWALVQKWFIPARFVDPADWVTFGIYLIGALLVLSEGNLLVRYVIDRLDLRPKARSVIATQSGAIEPVPAESPQAPSGPDPAEFNRGRVIGLLERLIMFELVLLGQFSAIGFLIAAKAMARFKTLEDRDFAEYFLVGTLASLAIAGGVAILVQWLHVHFAAPDWSKIQ
jgi:hypothetical protein